MQPSRQSSNKHPSCRQPGPEPRKPALLQPWVERRLALSCSLSKLPWQMLVPGWSSRHTPATK